MAHENNTESGTPDIDPAEAQPEAGMPDDPMQPDDPRVAVKPEGAAAQTEAQPTEEPAADDSAAAAPADEDEAATVRRELAERTDDLKRLHAEYVNYKRRVDRDRDLSRLAGVETVIMDLVPLLDNLRTARAHEGEFTGGLKLLADELDKVTTKHGLESYGAKDDPFDPQLHDALMQAPMPGVTEPVCLDVMQVGYRLKGRVVRPARVAVAVPADEATSTDAG